MCCIVLAIFMGIVSLYGFTAFVRVVGENDINRAQKQFYEAQSKVYQEKLKTYERDNKQAEAWQAVLRYLKARDGNSSTN